MATAIAEIERLAAEEGTDPATLMTNCVLEVDEEGDCERFEYPTAR